MAAYATAAECRAAANFSSNEWTDAQLNALAADATAEIDLLTGRTWQGVSYSTNEYLDGDGTERLILPRRDNITLTALAIDSGNTGTYTAINMSSATNNTGSTVRWTTFGVVYLNSGTEVGSFTSGQKTVRVSYTYGTAAATSEVRRLCIYKVLQYINFDAERQGRIDELVKNLRLDDYF